MKAKKKRNLIIMVAAAVILIGIFAGLQFINSRDAGDSEESAYLGELLTSFKESEISKITYQYRDGEQLNYKISNDNWYNADDEDFPLSSSAFSNNFVSSFVSASTSRKIEDAGEEENYGLDDPFLTLRVENFGGKEETYYLGDYNSMLGEYYLKIEGKDDIYTIGTTLVYICREDMYDYAEVESFPTYSSSTLNGVVIKNGETTVEYTYFEDGYETDLIGECKWFFKTPFSYYRSAETNKVDDMKSDIIDQMQFSKLVNYKPAPEDIEAYGLADSTRQYIINYRSVDEETEETTDCSKIVDIGSYDEETDCYYARVTEIEGNIKNVSNNIYLVSKTTADALLGIDPLDYVYKQVIYVKLIDIAKENANIIFNTPDGEYVLENKTTFKEDGGEDENIYYINGELMEERDVEDFYYEILANCGMERIIYDKSTVVTDKEPTYTITYNRNVDDYYGNVVVEYTQYDSNYYQATVNGSTDVLVNKRVLDETMALLAEMTQSES